MPKLITCPDGLTNDPARFINFIDSNCVPYTYMELFLFVGGCLLWVVAYGIIIRNALKFKYMDMAAVAVGSNFAWEFLWSWPFATDMGWFLVWTYRAWFFLDIYIFWLLLKYGAKQVSQPAFKKHFKPATVLITLAIGVIYYYFIKEGFDTPIGAHSAYIAQIIVSSLCLVMLLGTPTLEGFSLAVAYLRTIGTGMNTVMMLLHYPTHHFLHSMGIIAFVLDVFYIVYLTKRRSEEPALAVAVAVAR